MFGIVAILRSICKFIIKMDAQEDVCTEEEFSEKELKRFNAMPEAAFANLKFMLNRINLMEEKELVSKLKCFGLAPEGDVETMKKTLKNSYKKISLASVDLSLSSELVPYYVVIDFEATCEQTNPRNFRHEIIEFPAVLVNSKRQQIIDTFQMYCKPEINCKISQFCTELTGITQEQVDSAEPFEKVLDHFESWLAKHNLGRKHKYAVVTDGPLDMIRFLYSQCHYSNVKYPKWALRWVNLRQAFSKFYQCEKMCLKNMLEFLDIDFDGRPHCGLDDSRNIARIVLRMIYDGANIQINEQISTSKKPKIYRGKSGLENKAITRGDCQENEEFEKKGMFRVEARYAAIHTTNELPVYRKSRRDRLVAEVQIARRILSDHNSAGVNGQKPSNIRRKKIKKES